MLRARGAALVLIVAALLMMIPRTASAESDILAWLEELSGPGPFHSKLPALSGGVRVLCGSKSVGGVHGYWEKYGSDPDAGRPCFENTGDIKWSLFVNYTYLTTGDTTQFNELAERAVNAHTIDIYARLRVHPAVDLGMGVGGTYFTDNRSGGFNAIGNYTYTPVSLVVRPAQFLWDTRWARSIGVVYNQTVRFGRLTGAGFGSPFSSYSAGTELNARATIVFDPGPFFAKK